MRPSIMLMMTVSVPVALTVVSPLPAAEAPGDAGLLVGALERVQAVLVATLTDATVRTVNHTDFGQGLLALDRVLYPPGLEAPTLLLRWHAPHGQGDPALDPRLHADRPAVWLVRFAEDGSVRADSLGSTLCLDGPELARLRLEPWPRDAGDEYQRKAQALDEFLSTFDLASARAMPSGGAAAIPRLPVSKARFELAFRDYRDLPTSKALAFALDADGSWVYGYAHGMPDDRTAERQALLECAQQAARYGVDAPCAVLAVGDRVIAGK